ncbi:META and DUF4377 domain-containing protein [Oxalobacter paraformigenes]|uniref:META domain-containing protein n=1 Tax=Oxalobacter paraformigenes TaxID=556268 RepID=C3X1I5_9BURK|nr:META and DUF4377 domain-containing protein [Oxalobacter paraformigenes]EEO27071.1 hypothetical protein OFAG_00224 [Oxalobacter paraformigenes]
MKRYLLSLLAIPLVLAGCAQLPESNPPVSQAVDSLDAFHWQLTDATSRNGNRLDYLFVQPGNPVQLDFQTNRFTVSNTCNVISGNYLLTDNVITFSNMVSTKMLCANPQLNTLEQQVASQLQNRADIDIYLSATPVLKLRFYDGNTLTFTGRPTAGVQYGGTGETVFMEIASNTITCSAPMMPQKQCLQVRDVYYDNGGVITGTSTWRPFYPNIQGYQHREGIGHILRLKRYNVPNAPDYANQAYVLDMIVQ